MTTTRKITLSLVVFAMIACLLLIACGNAPAREPVKQQQEQWIIDNLTAEAAKATAEAAEADRYPIPEPTWTRIPHTK